MNSQVSGQVCAFRMSDILSKRSWIFSQSLPGISAYNYSWILPILPFFLCSSLMKFLPSDFAETIDQILKQFIKKTINLFWYENIGANNRIITLLSGSKGLFEDQHELFGHSSSGIQILHIFWQAWEWMKDWYWSLLVWWNFELWSCRYDRLESNYLNFLRKWCIPEVQARNPVSIWRWKIVFHFWAL